MHEVAVPVHRLGHVLALVGAFLLIISVTFLSPLTLQTVDAFGSSEITELTNKARMQLGGTELKPNTQLTSAAQAKADDMAKQQFFAHTAPDGTMAWDYIKQTPYSYEIAGENLAITNESAETVITSWMNSPSHKENIVNPSYQDIGIGIARYGDYQGHKDTTVIVALYAKSAGIQVVGATTNPAGGTAIMQPNYLNIPPLAVASVAGLLIIAGLALEFRHLRRLNHKLT
jgi:Cysteine-rich secretory protein family